MENLGSIIKDWVWLIATGVGLIAWLARLENRSKQNKADIQQESEERARDDTRESQERTKELGRLENHIEQKRAEDREQHLMEWKQTQDAIKLVQSDVKELLQRTARR